MNTPSTCGGSNWAWRMDDSLLGSAVPSDAAVQSDAAGTSDADGYSAAVGTPAGNEKAAWLKRLAQLSGRNITE